jgi:hypothetical protein
VARVSPLISRALLVPHGLNLHTLIESTMGVLLASSQIHRHPTFFVGRGGGSEFDSCWTRRVTRFLNLADRILIVAAIYARKSTKQHVAAEKKSVARQVEHARAAPRVGCLPVFPATEPVECAMSTVKCGAYA